MTTLQTIPVDILETIAFFVAVRAPTGPPSGLVPLFLTSTHIASSLSRAALPHLYALIFRHQFDTAAINRRFPSEARAGHHLSDELVRRWQAMKRIRSGGGQDPSTEDLWLIYLMCMENDGRNLVQLLHYARIPVFLRRYRRHKLLPQVDINAASNLVDVLNGNAKFGRKLPNESVEISLALWIHWYMNDHRILSAESPDERADNLYMLRLFVFAAQKFDAFCVPWNHLLLPLPATYQHVRAIASESAFLADLAPTSRAITVEHLGQRLRIAPPVTAHAALLSFFARLALDASLATPGEEDGAPAPHPDLDTSAAEAFEELDEAMPPAEGEGDLTGGRESIDFDLDWERMTRCLDPVVPRLGDRSGSKGLDFWRVRGSFEGVWGGSFSFLDFDSYREMLSGRSRSIYEGPFGLQPQIWRLTETLVLRPAGVAPFSWSQPCPALQAGFPPSWTPPGDLSNAESLTGVQGYRSVSAAQEAEWRERGEVPSELEIVVTGTGHSAWGRFYVSGRIRAWDGMCILSKEYYPDSRGKWIYRGYVLAGGTMVGRWRDTFTPESWLGYEGCWSMKRRGDERN